VVVGLAIEQLALGRLDGRVPAGLQVDDLEDLDVAKGLAQPAQRGELAAVDGRAHAASLSTVSSTGRVLVLTSAAIFRWAKAAR
jgi:hypothetical protein